MKWVSKSHIFAPSGRHSWSVTHAQVPTPLFLADKLRIYFATRGAPIDGQFVSNISFIEVESAKPSKLVYVHDNVCLPLGERGSFDEFGVMPGSLIQDGDDLLLYYTGWSRGTSVPYITAIGLAKSVDGGITFKKFSNGPIIGRGPLDPYLVNGPYVIRKDNQWLMWYSSCYQWIDNDGTVDPVYKIKRAASTDGVHWECEAEFCVPEVLDMEAQNAPCVFLIGESYYMAFCYRPNRNFRHNEYGYKIDMAVSSDLINWSRGESGLHRIDLSPTDNWDRLMQAYPRVISVKDKHYMFYNGNYFGKNGFGYAVLS